MIQKEKRSKRRNLLLWQENRLRRLNSKLESVELYRSLARGASICDVSDESINRCLDRAHRLACDIQIEWSRRYAEMTIGGCIQ